jgi:hypothetical protein
MKKIKNPFHSFLNLNKKCYLHWKKNYLADTLIKKYQYTILIKNKSNKFYFKQCSYFFSYLKSNKHMSRLIFELNFLYNVHFNYFYFNLFQLIILNKFHISFKIFYIKNTKKHLNFYNKNNFLL